MKPEFAIDAHEFGATVTALRLRGRLDARAASVLTSRCAEVRSAGRHLVLNLAGVTFIAGIHHPSIGTPSVAAKWTS